MYHRLYACLSTAVAKPKLEWQIFNLYECFAGIEMGVVDFPLWAYSYGH